MSLYHIERPCKRGRMCFVQCPQCAEAERNEPRPLTGFFARLTPEQQATALAYDGPEDFGDPDGPKAALAQGEQP